MVISYSFYLARAVDNLILQRDGTFSATLQYAKTFNCIEGADEYMFKFNSVPANSRNIVRIIRI